MQDATRWFAEQRPTTGSLRSGKTVSGLRSGAGQSRQTLIDTWVTFTGGGSLWLGCRWGARRLDMVLCESFLVARKDYSGVESAARAARP